MVPERIKMAKGGETLTEVMGRKEEDELPVFQNGAFEVDGGEKKKKNEKEKLFSEEMLNQYVSQGEVLRHTMRELMNSIEIVEGKDFVCDEVREILRNSNLHSFSFDLIEMNCEREIM